MEGTENPDQGVDGAALDDAQLTSLVFGRLGSFELVQLLELGSIDSLWIARLGPSELWVSPGLAQVLGYPPGTVLSEAQARDHVLAPDAVLARDAARAVLADPSHPFDLIMRIRHVDGSTLWMRSRGVPLLDRSGRPELLMGTLTDVTAERRIQAQLAETNRRLESTTSALELLESATAALQLTDDPDDVVASLVRILGHQVGDRASIAVDDGHMLELVACDALDPLDAARMREVDDAGLRSSPQGPVERVIRSNEALLIEHVDGDLLRRQLPDVTASGLIDRAPDSIIVVPWTLPDGRRAGVAVTRFDDGQGPFGERDLRLTRQLVERHAVALDRIELQREREAEGRFQRLARSAPLGILVLDDRLECSFANTHWCTLSGRSVEETLGLGWRTPFESEVLAAVGRRWAESGFADNIDADLELRRPDGTTRWVRASAATVRRGDGSEDGALIAIVDVTAQRRSSDELRRRSREDPLTGCANRNALFELLERSSVADSVARGLVYIDLDNFKELNDTFGHLVGDQLLVEFTRRIRSVLRGDDVIARLGGDEFVVVVHDTGGRIDLTRIAERLRSSLRQPLILGDRQVHMSMSMGLLEIDAASAAEGRTERLLSDADRAMYRAKSAGRGSWAVFDPDIDVHVYPDQDVRAHIAAALAADGVVVHYQPIVDVATGDAIGLEALVRLQHPTLGLLPPGTFLEVAERSGQIVEIGDRVIDRALAEFSEWSRKWPDLVLTLNLSGRQLADATVCDRLVEGIGRHALSPDRIVVEVIEDTLVNTLHTSLDALGRLRSFGIRFAVDDFGTGYSSLSRLTDIAPDVIKIDRSFVISAARDPFNHAIISSVMHLAELTGTDVVAEGVETESQLQTVEELGCRLVQGFLFSRPTTADEVPGLLGADFVTANGGRADFGA